MSELQMNPEVLRAAAGRLDQDAAELSATGSTCLAVDAGEWTGQVTALVQAVTGASHELASALAGGAGALQAAAGGITSLDQGVGQTFGLGGLGRP